MTWRLDIYCEYENAGIEIHRSYIIGGSILEDTDWMEEYFRICARDFATYAGNAMAEKAAIQARIKSGLEGL